MKDALTPTPRPASHPLLATPLASTVVALALGRGVRPLVATEQRSSLGCYAGTLVRSSPASSSSALIYQVYPRAGVQRGSA